MKSAFFKDTLRTIRRSSKRFVSIIAIMALGLTVFVGVTATSDNMFLAADRFYDKQQVFDIRVLSTLGLTDEDVNALESVDGIKAAAGMYSETVNTFVNDKKTSADMIMLNSKGLNAPYLIEGSIPSKQGEIAVTEKYLSDTGKSVGDKIVIEEEIPEADIDSSNDAIAESGDTNKTGADLNDADAGFAIDKSADAESDDANKTGADLDNADSGLAIDKSEKKEVNIEEEITIDFDENAPNFKNTEYTISGIVIDPLDIKAPSEGGASYRTTETIDYTFFITPEDVETNVYTSICIALDGLNELQCFSQKYDDSIQSVVDIIETNIMVQRQKARYDEVIAEAKEKIATAEESMNDKFAEYDAIFEDAWADIKKARVDISYGEDELIQAETETYSKFRDARKQIRDGKDTIEKNRKELSKALKKIKSGEVKYNLGIANYNSKLSQYKTSVNNMKSLNQGVSKGIPASLNTMQSLISKYPSTSQWASASQKDKNAFTSASNSITGVVDGMAAVFTEGGGKNAAALLSDISKKAKSDLKNGDYLMAFSTLSSLNSPYDPSDPSTDSPRKIMQSTISTSSKTLKEYKKALDAAKSTLDEAKTELKSGKAKHDKGVKQLEKAASDIKLNESDLNSKETDALQEIATAWKDIEDFKLSINEGEEELTAEEQEYTEKKDDASKKIIDAYAKLSEIDMTQWYVQNRTSISSYTDFNSNISSIGAVGQVFPILFLIVAILISLTTMTRMVEEERGLIGTYKALGYSNFRIGLKYIIYALFALLIGSVIGCILGFIALPKAFIFMLDLLFSIPEIKLRFDVLNAILGALLFIVCILITTAIACRKELKQSPATIMRPKAPRIGSRILLEHVPFVWEKLQFLNKITARNIFRYKRRLLMTIIGIAGCTALVLTGFAIRDSGHDVMPKQYENIFRYDIMAVANPDDASKLQKFCEDDTSIADYLSVQLENAKIFNENEEFESIQMVVLPKGKSLEEYLGLFNLEGNKIEIDNENVYVSLNAAKLLNLQKGDPVIIQNLLLDRGETVVGDVVENYMGNFVYISQELYESLIDEYRPNTVYVNLTDGTSNQKSFAENLIEKDFIMASFSILALSEQYEREIVVLDYVLYMMTFLAAVLAFLVLFTLANTNISERVRELATIKVLGFYDKEVYSYINKETFILTIIGVFLGMPLGYFFGKLFTLFMQLPSLELVLAIRPISYVLAGVITLVFALIVSRMTNRIIKRINMVEALKSTE